MDWVRSERRLGGASVEDMVDVDLYADVKQQSCYLVIVILGVMVEDVVA